MKEEGKDYKTMATSELERELDETVDYYEEQIGMEYEVNEDWDSEVFLVVSIRDEIHQLASELRARKHNFDSERIRTLDKKWQLWVLENRDPNFRFDYRITPGSKKEWWWWWVDQLDILTEDQRSTL